MREENALRAGSVDSGADEWIDKLLRHDAAAAQALADDGFSAALMQHLPAHAARLQRYRWIVPAMGVVGFVVGFIVLSGGEDLSMLLTGLAQARAFTLQNLLLAALPLGVLYWIALGAAWQET